MWVRCAVPPHTLRSKIINVKQTQLKNILLRNRWVVRMQRMSFGIIQLVFARVFFITK